MPWLREPPFNPWPHQAKVWAASRVMLLCFLGGAGLWVGFWFMVAWITFDYFVIWYNRRLEK